MPLMCTSTAHPQSGKPDTVYLAGSYQENVGSTASMGASGYRDQGWEEGKHVEHAREERIRQSDNRVRCLGVPNV